MDKKDFKVRDKDRHLNYCVNQNLVDYGPRIELNKLYLFMERNRSFMLDMMNRDGNEHPYIWEVINAVERNISDEFITYVYDNTNSVIMMKAIYSLLFRGYITTKEEIDDCLKIDSDYHLFEIITCCGQDRGKDHFINIKNDYIQNVGTSHIKEFKWYYDKGNIHTLIEYM